jgi:hypothetical protein
MIYNHLTYILYYIICVYWISRTKETNDESRARALPSQQCPYPSCGDQLDWIPQPKRRTPSQFAARPTHPTRSYLSDACPALHVQPLPYMCSLTTIWPRLSTNVSCPLSFPQANRRSELLSLISNLGAFVQLVTNELMLMLMLMLMLLLLPDSV